MNIIIGSATHVVALTSGFYAHPVKGGGRGCVCVLVDFLAQVLSLTPTLGIFHLFFFFFFFFFFLFSVLPTNP